jgi:ssDNA-binding Zn-finger/Zn-ribbon topoisomerase 1
VPEPEVDWGKITMPCPVCRETMVVRQNKSNGARFMGCTNWPITGCSGRASVPTYALLRAQGATVLPGFEDA